MLKRKLGRYIALILVSVMLLSACGSSDSSRVSNSEESASTTVNTVSADEDTANEEPLKIKIIPYANASGYYVSEDSPVQQLLEERFNVEFELVQVNIHNEEEMNLYFAQGGTADVINYNKGDLDSWIEQGLLREISIDDLYEKMPNYIATMEGLFGGDAAQLRTLIPYKGGATYAIPYVGFGNIASGVTYVRKDWMEAVGIDSVTSVEEFEELLHAFTYGDPDGNGVDDTYGIHGGQRFGFNLLWGAYGGVKQSYYADENGKVSYYSATPEYKEVLTILNRWYEAGYIDPEFVTDDRTMQRNKWSESKFGILEDTAGWSSSAQGGSGILAMVEAKNPDASFDMIDPFEGPYGIGSFIEFPDLNGDAALFFGADCSDEIVYKMMEIREALATDKELFLRCYYGVEGEDYTMNADGTLAVNSALSAENFAEQGLRTCWAAIPISLDRLSLTFTERDTQTYTQSQSQPKVFSDVSFVYSGTNESNNIYGEDVTKITQEYYYNAIRGDVEIEATFDSYVQKLNDAGLDKIIAEYEELLVK